MMIIKQCLWLPTLKMHKYWNKMNALASNKPLTLTTQYHMETIIILIASWYWVAGERKWKRFGRFHHWWGTPNCPVTDTCHLEAEHSVIGNCCQHRKAKKGPSCEDLSPFSLRIPFKACRKETITHVTECKEPWLGSRNSGSENEPQTKRCFLWRHGNYRDHGDSSLRQLGSKRLNGP